MRYDAVLNVNGTDYPVEILPLAKARPDDPTLTERFELFAADFGELGPLGDLAEGHEKVGRRRARQSLLESLEILFTDHCCEEQTPVVSAFVVDLYAEASRNPRVADLVRDVLQTAMAGVTELISRAPEAQNTTRGGSPSEVAELIFAVARGMLMLDVLRPQEMTATERRNRQLEVTRKLWRLLFKPEAELAYA